MENIKESSSLSQKNYDHILLIKIVDKVVKSLRINWEDKQIVKNLLISSLESDLCGKNGLLEKYLNDNLNILAEELTRQLKIKNVGINENHATHAKFNDIISEIKNKTS